MDFELLREEKCNSFKFIRRKIIRAKYFSLWTKKYHEISTNSQEKMLISTIESINNRKLLRKYFFMWKRRHPSQSYSKTEMKISSLTSDFEENDDRYEEFYKDLQDMVLHNAELETKKSLLDEKSKEIEDIINQLKDHNKAKKEELSRASIKNETLLRRLAEVKLKNRDEVVRMQTKLSITQSKIDSMTKTESSLTPNESIQFVQDAQEMYNAKINGIKILLKNYKDQAVDMRRKYNQVVIDAKKYEREISVLEESIKSIEEDIKKIPVNDNYQPNTLPKPTKKLLKEIVAQLGETRAAILENESEIAKNTSEIRALHIKLLK